MNNAVLWGSAVDTWETPQDFFDDVNKVFRFNLDVCALPQSAKCKKYFTPEDDALTKDWKGTCWMNPPYGKGITGKWMRKAAEESAKHNSEIVCLVPARTDTIWWHEYVGSADSIMFLKGRLKFGGSKDPAPFPSALILFGGDSLSLSDLRHKFRRIGREGMIL